MQLAKEAIDEVNSADVSAAARREGLCELMDMCQMLVDDVDDEASASKGKARRLERDRDALLAVCQDVLDLRQPVGAATGVAWEEREQKAKGIRGRLEAAVKAAEGE